MNKHNDMPIKSLSNSLEIIETLDELGGTSLTELSDRMNLADSTIFDHLKTLENAGYVLKEGEHYVPSLKFLQIGGHRRDRMQIYQIAMPELREIAYDIGERVNLIYEEAGRCVLLEVLKGEGAVFQETYLGSHLDFHCTAAGKAIIAFKPKETVKEFIEKYGLYPKTGNTIVEEDAFFDELEQIREQGYALDLEESHQGLHCVGAPIKGESNQALASVSISGPKSKFDRQRMEGELANRMVQVANVIEINFTYGRGAV